MLKKFKSRCAVPLLALLIVLCTQRVVYADYTPYSSFIPVGGYYYYGYSQDMFKPDAVLSGVTKTPQDLYLNDEMLYVADAGLRAVVVLTQDGDLAGMIGEGVLDEPTGVFVDERYVYVADYGKQTAFKFDKSSGEVVRTYTKPNNPLFGRTEPFRPLKLVADGAENVYIISEGGTSGVIQMNEEGEFLGYFGVNTSRVTTQMIMQRMFSSATQRGQLLSIKPPSPNSISIDHDGLIYTVTANDSSDQRIKKLNIAGNNIFKSDFSFENMIAVDIDKNGNVFYLTSDHVFGFYDSFGNLININLTFETASEIMGVFGQPSGLVVADDGSVFISDASSGQIVKLIPTEIATLVLDGIKMYKDGLYVECMDIWSEVLNLNANFMIAHNAMAKAYFKQGDSARALEEFQLSEDKLGYSNAFWERRNAWLEDWLGLVLIGLFVWVVVRSILKRVDKKHGIYNPFRNFSAAVKRTRVYGEFHPVLSIMFHPVDTCDYIKRSGRVSVIGALCILVFAAVLQVLGQYSLGFAFTDRFRENIDVPSTIIMLVAPIVMYILANYLVSTITDGEGSFRDMVCGTVSSFAPLILLGLPLCLLTNVLTVNESFLFSFAMLIIYGWSLLNLFVTTMSLHDYTFGGTVKNWLLTAAGMVILLIVSLISYVLVDQLIRFVLTFR